jgi:hypothetical protein
MILVVRENPSCQRGKVDYALGFVAWRGSQVVRQGSAKASSVGSIPTSASKSKLPKGNKLQKPEEASASESASEITTGIEPLNYPGITRQPLEMTGLAARFV